MDIKTVSDMIYQHTEDRERMEKMNAIYYEMADFIKRKSPEAYAKFYQKAEDVAYSITTQEAKEYVAAMKPFGEHWSMQTISDYIEGRIDGSDDIEYYVAMNMMFNDYKRTAAKYGQDNSEFYLDLAYDFLNDEDAGSHKLARYMKI